MLQSSNLTRIFASEKTGTGTGLTQGFYANNTYPAIVGGLGGIIDMGSPVGTRDRSVQLRRLYTNALNNISVLVDLHTVEIVSSGIEKADRTGLVFTKLGRLTLTASSVVGDGVFVPSDRRYFDTAVWTPSAYGTHLFTALGTDIQVFSPADNATPVSVVLPDLGGCFGLFIEPFSSGSTINGYVKRFT